jgi:SAM-dependent methyltransferase
MVTARTTSNGRNGAHVENGARVVPLKRRAAPEALPDFLHTEPSETYYEDLRAEAAWWDGCSETLSGKNAPFGFQEYQNERLTGDPNRLWYETIVDYGQFKRGCAIGAGQGHIEAELLGKMPELRLDVHDISRDSLARLDAKLEEQFPGRTSFHEDDMNFFTLPENTYDLVVSQSCIHHILNLEHLAYQVNRALTPDGMFFLMDRVSETQYDFPEEKKRIFEGFLAMSPDGPNKKVYWPERENWNYSPFEGVRSGEILDVFSRYLSEAHRRTSSSLIELMLFVGPSAAPPGTRSLRERIAGRLRRELFMAGLRVRGAKALAQPQSVARGGLLKYLDGFLCDSGALQPGLAFTAYRKRP